MIKMPGGLDAPCEVQVKRQWFRISPEPFTHRDALISVSKFKVQTLSQIDHSRQASCHLPPALPMRQVFWDRWLNLAEHQVLHFHRTCLECWLWNSVKRCMLSGLLTNPQSPVSIRRMRVFNGQMWMYRTHEILSSATQLKRQSPLCLGGCPGATWTWDRRGKVHRQMLRCCL